MRTTSSLWLLGMAEQLKWLGLPVTELFEQADIPLPSLANTRVRVPQDNISRLWRAVEKASGSEAIGLVVGEALGFSGMAGATVGLLECTSASTAIDIILRYQKVIGETSNIHWQRPSASTDESRRLVFAFYDDQQPLSPHTIDVAMASMVRLARMVEGKNWRPLQVELRRRVKDRAAHRAYYDCDVKFGCRSNAIDIPITAAQSQPSIAGNLIAESDGCGVAEMVAMVLPEQLRMGAFHRRDIAALFSMSEKTLQRRLAEEGHSFSRILDTVRANQSRALLLEGGYTQTEVAFLCGFSDLSAFHHAFRRWYGVAPGGYVAENLWRVAANP